MHCLHRILGIKWQDKIINTTVLERADAFAFQHVQFAEVEMLVLVWTYCAHG